MPNRRACLDRQQVPAFTPANPECDHDEHDRLRAAESMGLEQAERRQVRKHQPADRRALTHEKELPVGKHPLQLYSLATPNGQKVTIMLEELLALGHKGAEYDAWLIKIGEGEQFGSGFVAVNPNSKIPGAHGPQRSEAHPRVRIRRDPHLPRREVRRLPADRAGGARRVPVLAVLADGQRALSRRRLRPFLRLCADQDRIRDRPLRHGGEAPARRARQAAGAASLRRRRRATPSPISPSGRGTAAW